ncbi:MAG TPA: hypothetical protein VN844_08615 [Pyrinomonadaceae bacterium]|nr:hypothetical protein [Pyrinomonadaceae bacterium]
MQVFDSNEKIGVCKASQRTSNRKFLASLFALGFAVLFSSPCGALSERVNLFKPATAEEAARWTRLLKLEASPGVEIKSATMQLIDVTLSITRIESEGCGQGVCVTFFKYHLDKDFEFVIPCEPEMTVLNRISHDGPTGKDMLSMVLVTGYDLTATVLPTSLGPFIKTGHGDLP